MTAPAPTLSTTPTSTMTSKPEVFDMIREAFARRITTETLPKIVRLDRLRDQIAAFEVQIHAEAQQQAVQAMLTALGNDEKVPPVASSTHLLRELRASIKTVLQLVDEHDPFVQAVLANDAASTACSEPDAIESDDAESDALEEETAPESVECVQHNTWPRLRAAVQAKPFAVIGGITIREKVTLVRKRFGFDMTWMEIDQGSPRDTETIVHKIRNMSFGAVILLESFMPHKASGSIIEALNAYNIPWAYGGRCGLGQLSVGFESIETKLVRRAA